MTSPSGRQSTTVLDLQGREVSMAMPDMAPRRRTYDSRGRLTTISQGSGTDLRRIEVTHDADGLPRTVTDPLLNTIVYDRDGDGRITTATRAGGREVGLGYDRHGNLVSVTPPSRPPHTFGFTALEAMWRDCPVIASDIPALREVSGEGAMLLPAADLSAWASAIRRIASDEATREDLRRRGRERVKLYSWDSAARAVCRLFLEAGA
jgi:YD repeat-containing protein